MVPSTITPPVADRLTVTADAARMFAAEPGILAVTYDYTLEGVGVIRDAVVTRDDVAKAYAAGLIACPTCGDTVEYCSRFLTEVGQ